MNWYYRPIRHQVRKELETLHAGKEEEKEKEEKKVDDSSSSSDSEEEEERTEKEDEKGEENAERASEDTKQDALAEAEQQEREEAAALPDAAKAALPVAEEAAGHVKDAGPAPRGRKRNPVPADTCPACWNERRAGWAGCKHRRELPSCRLHKAEGSQQKRPRRSGSCKCDSSGSD